VVEPGAKEVFGGGAGEHAKTPRNQREQINRLGDILPKSGRISLQINELLIFLGRLAMAAGSGGLDEHGCSVAEIPIIASTLHTGHCHYTKF
jgi:hypothetical protein